MDGLLPSTTTTNGQTKVINSFYANAVNHPVTSPSRDYHHPSHHHPHHQAPSAMESYFIDHQSTIGGGDNLGTYGNHQQATPQPPTSNSIAPGTADSHHYSPSAYLANTAEASFFDQTTHHLSSHHHHNLATRLHQLNLDPNKNHHPSTTSQQPQPPPQTSQKTTYTDQQSNKSVPVSQPPPQSMVINRTTNETAAAAMLASSGNPNDNSNLSFFVSDSMREELVRRLAKRQEMVAENTNVMELPAKVDVFIELGQIEPLCGASSFSFNGMPSTVYRATNSETGQLFCLRRFHGFPPHSFNSKLFINTMDSWKKIQHANIISLRQVFTTKAFGDNSVIFVYDYHPLCETMMSCYFSSQLNSLTAVAAVGTHPAAAAASSMMNGYSTSSRPYSQQQNTRNKFLPEQTIWNYIIQISSALRTIHQAGLAFRSLDPTKILITSGWSGSVNNGSVGGGQSSNNINRGRDARVKLSFSGVFDILTLDTFHHSNPSSQNRAFIQHLQQEDLVLFGRLCLAISTNSLVTFTQRDLNIQEYMDLLPRTYSNDLRNLISYLISYKANASKPRSIDDIMPMIGARFYMQLDYFYLRYDFLYEELTKEMDNGRLLRLLSKLGTINERPEHQLDPNWSETGDRYMLKLFRDYLFHQFDENGKPWLDLGHIISNLNKFDVGSPERICLISRDAQNVIIVTFEELKRCFEAAINDLMQ